jgi:hypothetical protein
MKQYRIVVLGNIQNYYSAFLYGTLEGAIRNGAWAKTIQLINRGIKDISDEITFMKPHFLFCHMVFGPKRDDVLELFRKIRKNFNTKIIYHMGDARKMPRFNGNVSDFVDLGIINHLEQNPFSDVWRIPTIHWPYMCFYQKEIAEPEKMYKCDMAFTGDLDSSSHHAPRQKFIKELRSLINIKTFPTPDTGNTRFQTAELSSSADGVFGMQMGLDIDGYQDVRPFQYIGAGAIYYHDKHPHIDQFFEDGLHYVSYKRDNAKSLKEKFDEYSKTEKGKKIREEGFKFCQRYHSTKERVQIVLNYFEGKDLPPLYKEELM